MEAEEDHQIQQFLYIFFSSLIFSFLLISFVKNSKYSNIFYFQTPNSIMYVESYYRNIISSIEETISADHPSRNKIGRKNSSAFLIFITEQTFLFRLFFDQSIFDARTTANFLNYAKKLFFYFNFNLRQVGVPLKKFKYKRKTK